MGAGKVSFHTLLYSHEPADIQSPESPAAARAKGGHTTAAPPRRVMKSRRLMRSIRDLIPGGQRSRPPGIQGRFHASAPRSMITSDAGLPAYRELDVALELIVMAGAMLVDARTGKNGRHALVGLLRQSLFGRLNTMRKYASGSRPLSLAVSELGLKAQNGHQGGVIPSTEARRLFTTKWGSSCTFRKRHLVGSPCADGSSSF